jgi:hypothetical protein
MENKLSVHKYSQEGEQKMAAAYSQYALPTFRTSYDGKFIKWLDTDGKSQWPDLLIEYKNNSALHGRLCRSIIQQIQGAGFLFDVSSAKAGATQEFLDKENADGDKPYDVFKKQVNDEYILGMSSILLEYEKNKKSVMEVQYIPMSKLRANPIDPSTYKIPGWWYCFDWSKQSGTKNPMTFIPSNNFKSSKNLADQYEQLVKEINLEEPEQNLREIEKIFGSANQCIEIHAPTIDTASFYYPSLPFYSGGLAAIRTSISVGRYNINSIENGLNVDSIMFVPGLTSDREKLKFANEANAQFRNPDRGKQTMYVYYNSDADKPSVEPLNTNSEDKLYSKINDNVKEDILTAHGCTSPELYGIQTPGKLGTSEISDSEDIFYKNVIKPLQFQMLEPINKIMRYNGLEELTIERLKISVQSTETKETETDVEKTTTIKTE